MIQASVRSPQAVIRRNAGEPRVHRFMSLAALVTVAGFSLGYSSIGFGLLFFGALWSLIRYRRVPWAPTLLDIPLAVFGGVLLVSAAVSPYPRVAIVVTLMLLVSGAVYFGAFTWLLAIVPGIRDRLLRAWAAGAVLAAITGLVYRALAPRFALHDVLQGRAEIPRGVGPNGLGTTLMLGGILSAGLALRAERGERLLWVAAGVCCLAGLLASGSRASLAGWIVGVAYVVWRETRGRPRQMAAIAAGALLLLVGAAAATPQFSGRLGHTVSDVNGNRLRIWHTSLEMIADHPLLGTGFGTFERAYDRRRPPGASLEPFAFNLWLNLAVETGLMGLAAALWVAVAAVRSWRRRRGSSGPPGAADMDPAIVALWIGLLVDQLADNTLFSISTSAGLWLLLALIAVAPRSGKNRGAEPAEPGNGAGSPSATRAMGV